MLTNKRLAYALLRIALGVNFLGHGLFRILSGVPAFAATTADHMAKSPFPHGFNLAFPMPSRSSNSCSASASSPGCSLAWR